MQNRLRNKKHLFFYFYLKSKLTSIKEDIKDLKEKAIGDKKSILHQILINVAIAAGLTFLIYYTVVFVYLGELVWPTSAWIEMGLEFTFLFLLLTSHRYIAHFFRKNPPIKSSSTLNAAVEMIVVVVSALILHYLANYLPISLIYDSSVFDPVRVRNGYAIGVIVALFLYYFVELRKRERQLQQEKLRSARLQKENFQAQLESLKQQVNPHFLFNSLNVLGSLVYSDQDKAVDFIRKLSDLYRSYLDNGAELLIDLEKELKVTQAYTYLLETRFGDSVHFDFKIDPEKLDLQIPPGSLQMLIENAVKHNGSTKKSPLRVKIESTNNELVVSNFLNPRKESIQSTRTGLKNIKNRYSFLTDKEVSIQKTQTKFIVKLPLLKVETYESSDHRG